MDEVITLQFDGGSRGNPGPAGIGVVLRAADGTPIVTLGRFIGRATNNVAEYKALITALAEAEKLGATMVVVRGDSELVVKQMRGEYRVKNPDLKVLYDEAQARLARFAKAKVEHNYREDNALADKLANLAMDRRRDVTDVDGDDGGAAPSTTIAPALRSVSRPGAPTGPPVNAGPLGRASTVATAPSVNSVHACPRCGCAVTVTHASSRPPADLGPFACTCGVRMKVVE
ncbi:MAG: ribonuclease [Phycisphaerales bacterium]|nr:ribonuclease [Phycisphaerales bacterium]